jgi:hypothetical protein
MMRRLVLLTAVAARLAEPVPAKPAPARSEG